MKDMFFNYDNNIRTDPPEAFFCEPQEKQLESNPNLALVKDIKGNDIGICARYGADFDLYFTLIGYVENSSVEELIKKSTIIFKVVDHWNKEVIKKELSAEEAYYGNDVIKISISREEALKLRQETYNIILLLEWADGEYILYNKDNGFLTIK